MSSIMAKSKILIVEDDPDIQELLHFNLEKAGFQTFRAENGEQAVLLAQKHSPDLILLDLLLPGMDGLELLKVIRAEKLSPDSTIVMLTNQADDFEKVKQFNVDGYIIKATTIPSEVVDQVLAIYKNKINN